MTQEIQGRDVREVLLADGWHEVANKSFKLESLQVAGPPNWVDKYGFSFEEVSEVGRVSGPTSSILALRHG